MKFNLFRNKQLTEEQKKIKFYRKLRISDKTTDEEKKAKIFAYLKNAKDLDKVYFTFDQLNDPVFMSTVYNINPDILQYYKPSLALQENLMFMKVFIRNAISNANHASNDMQIYLTQVLSSCKQALKNYDVVKYLIDNSVDYSALLMIHDILLDTPNIYNQDYLSYLEILRNLPKDSLIRELRYNQGQVLSVIENDHEYYYDLAREASRQFGFNAIKHIARTYIMDKPDIIYFATSTDGIYGLYRYMSHELKENPSDLAIVNQEKRNLKKKLLRDEKINSYLNDQFFVANGMIDELYC